VTLKTICENFPTSKDPFYNREKQIEKIARICLTNLKRARERVSSDISTYPLNLLTASQMWGSGKSWLGNHFLLELHKDKYRSLLNLLMEEFGEDNVNALLKCRLILIDFRFYSPASHPLNYLNTLVLTAFLDAFDGEDRSYWTKQSPSNWTLANIVRHFSQKYGLIFFIHFDEVDKILQFSPPIYNSLSLVAAKRYYEFWQLITNIIFTTGSTVYCSGRSALLFSLGKGLYHTFDLSSPSKVTAILLDTFKIDTVRFCVEELNFGTSEGNIPNLL
jgi:hypothetical protein